METILDNNHTEERTIVLRLSERDLFLIEWSLDMMARSSPQTGTLRLEIDRLREK